MAERRHRRPPRILLALLAAAVALLLAAWGGGAAIGADAATVAPLQYCDGDPGAPAQDAGEDPDCTARYACSDYLDNDGDGKIDSADPGCWNNGAYDPYDMDEIDDAPPPPPPPPGTPPACSDALDNDGDGLVDMNDPGCSSTSDNDEYNSPTSPPPSGANSPIGTFDAIGDGTAWGWTCDADDYAAALAVHFYLDGPAGAGGTYLGATTANALRSDVAGVCGGTTLHGFAWPIPTSARDGLAHTLYAYGINVGATGSNALLNGSPQSFTLAPPQPVCTGAVILFEHADYRGRCWGFGAGEFAQLGPEADNRASSVQVQPGYVVSIFGDANFARGWTNVSTSASAAAWSEVGDDNVSSLIVRVPEDVAQSEPLLAPSSSSPEVVSGSCWAVSEGFSSYAWNGRRVLTYRLGAWYCVRKGRISWLGNRNIDVDVPPPPFPLSLVFGWKYSQSFFIPGEEGGTATRVKVQGTFENCAFKHGCTPGRTKWIAIDIAGDGTATCSSSARTSGHSCTRRAV